MVTSPLVPHKRKHGRKLGRQRVVFTNRDRCADQAVEALREVCGRAVEWPNGAPGLLRREYQQGR